MRTIVAGNWKMNTDRASALELAGAVADACGSMRPGALVVVAPPFPFIAEVAARCAGSGVVVAAQDCHPAAKGAYTGEVSASMLKSIGAQACIVGHSERRQYHGESDAFIGEKTAALLAHGLTPIVCCGELKAEREAARHFEVVSAQLDGALGRFTADELGRLIIAYEPVWAIGTGLTATSEQAQEMHARIRSWLRERGAEQVPVLYGGSCNPANAQGLFAQPDVDGGLIGGASLVADQFLELVRIADGAMG
jgi:triosephosphate isomerase